tara:strand:- start:886 stop:1740 length:855 start_codon:yes stop_codon:yes gene_type:complete
MKVLIGIPHVFNPVEGSQYSSQNESKRTIKQNALNQVTNGNLVRHSHKHFIHASGGIGTEVFTRELSTQDGVDLNIEVYTPQCSGLISKINKDPKINIIETRIEDFSKVPFITSKSLLEKAGEFDLICYMEDDLLIEDRDFFLKLMYLDQVSNNDMTFLPHRCEYIPNKGDVILSGDPDGGRPDLFWDTGETIDIQWPTGDKKFYRATNPHSGCYFLTRNKALKVKRYWEERDWSSDFELAGPLEQAASGMLLPILKIMKPNPSNYRFLMVNHLDELWLRHPFK